MAQACCRRCRYRIRQMTPTGRRASAAAPAAAAMTLLQRYAMRHAAPPRYAAMRLLPVRY